MGPAIGPLDPRTTGRRDAAPRWKRPHRFTLENSFRSVRKDSSIVTRDNLFGGAIGLAKTMPNSSTLDDAERVNKGTLSPEGDNVDPFRRVRRRGSWRWPVPSRSAIISTEFDELSPSHVGAIAFERVRRLGQPDEGKRLGALGDVGADHLQSPGSGRRGS